MYVSRPLLTETQLKRTLYYRMMCVHVVLLFCVLLVIARLIELQLLRHDAFLSDARRQQTGTLDLTARRGSIFAKNSKTGETTVLATNSTLDMLYVDPTLVDDPQFIARTLTDLLIGPEMYEHCHAGRSECLRELRPFFSVLYSPNEMVQYVQSGAVLADPTFTVERLGVTLPTLPELKERFAALIFEKISEKQVTNVPLIEGATIDQMDLTADLGIPGIEVIRERNYIRANPVLIPQKNINEIAAVLSRTLGLDQKLLRDLLRQRKRRYMPIMRRLPQDVSQSVRQALQLSKDQTLQLRKTARDAQAALKIKDPLQSIVVRHEEWRYYPDGTIGAQIVGFLDTKGEALYGIERTYHAQLRGQTGFISTVSDERGRDILMSDQTIVDARNGDSIVLTIDRFIQKKVEDIMTTAIQENRAVSGQAIIMDPVTGKIIAMVNVPVFDSNHYADATQKVLMYLPPEKHKEVVVEVYHPRTKSFVVKGYFDDLFTSEGRQKLSDVIKQDLAEIEKSYVLSSIARYYLYTGETDRYEIFPTQKPDVWLKYSNGIGVGAYRNRIVQDTYEPGSVMKPITMAIAIDEGEIVPGDTYDDEAVVIINDRPIDNAFNLHYGTVTMTNCLEKSINTCLTYVSGKVGKRLFHKMILRFGFGEVTGIELADEQPGDILAVRKWSDALLATAGFGQGIAVTPLQMVRAFAALANGGRLMKPYIVDAIVQSDGTSKPTEPVVLDQVIKPETAETVTAMLVSTVNNGQAKNAKVSGYRIAGKTGTAQIAGPGGEYEAGTGSTIASFIGFAPVHDPRFVILVKLDRPKTVAFGARSAAPVFKEIAAFLFRYYAIPPDESA